MGFDVVVVGNLNMDLVATTGRIPIPGETVLGGELTTGPGGKGANHPRRGSRLRRRDMRIDRRRR